MDKVMELAWYVTICVLDAVLFLVNLHDYRSGRRNADMVNIAVTVLWFLSAVYFGVLSVRLLSGGML